MASNAGEEYVYHSYNAGFIVLSYFVSVVGCWTTLELLHRKTSKRGLYNWYLLLGAATSMGAVAIWSMHFIGNRAITMEAGQPDLQIGYNPGFTAGSFFLPITGVAVSFYLFTISEQVTIAGTVAGGTLSGFAICGMHYLGQGGIFNYQAIYDWRYVLGSAIIAVVAATLALGVFFYFKSAWTNSWWKRMACACMLAVAVTGMHWVATVGTSYTLKPIGQITQDGMSRQTTVVVVLCLAIGCCIALFVFAAIGQQTRQRYADRAQQVVLACATWDETGRLLVTPEGLLPCRKITNTFMERSFEDVFSIEHPVFCWIFRASRCWPSVTDLIPGMRSHLRTTSFLKHRRPGSTAIARDGPEGTDDYSQVFKELFCIAAHDLATMIQQPLVDLGVLYDEIISTGTVKKPAHGNVFSRPQQKADVDDIERVHRVMTLGRGQLLFVVRQVNDHESQHLQAAGFRFAPVQQVVEHLARSMQITIEELRPQLDKMRDFPIRPNMLRPGTHVSCFALRPLYQRGFEVMVLKAAKNLLPSVALPYASFETWQVDFIKSLDNWSVGRCLQWLSPEIQSMLESVSDREKKFFADVFNGIFALSSELNEDFFTFARLTSKVLRVPCHDPQTRMSGHAEVIAFRVIIDVHQSSLHNARHEFTPARFFQCQQHVYPKAPDHAIFTRRVHQEFASVLERSERAAERASISSKPRGVRDLFSRRQGSPRLSSLGSHPGQREFSPSTSRAETSSEKDLVDDVGSVPFGGIHVSNEVTVNVTDIRPGDRSPDVEMLSLGVYTEAGVAPIELESFVDELLLMTMADRRQPRS